MDRRSRHLQDVALYVLRLRRALLRLFSCGLQLSLKRRLSGLGVCGAHIKMLEHFLQNLQTPFSLALFNVDNFRSRGVFRRMGSKVPKMTNAIYAQTQIGGKRLACIGFLEHQIDLLPELLSSISIAP